MHYDFIAIPDADVPQAVDATFQHILQTYASEANKTASVWPTCWQQGRSALDFLSQILRGASVALIWPP